MDNIILKARLYARSAHSHISMETVSGDIRPHIEHLQEVADLVWASGGSDIEIAAAFLHDSVEDTSTTIEDIEKHFGKEIARIVDELTDKPDLAELRNLERKTKQAERMVTKSQNAKRIKIADQTSNIRMIATDPKKTWSVENNRNYVIGAKMIADHCKGISPTLDELFDSECRKAAMHFHIES